MQKNFLLFLSLIFIACTQNKPNQTIIEYPKAQLVDDSVKYKIFCEAFKEGSSSPYFVVFTVKNKKTGEIKEICEESPFLEGALHIEHKKPYPYSFDMSQYKDRYFEFSNQEALDNISFDEYNSRILDSLRQAFNVDSLMYTVKNGITERFTFNRKDIQKMTAHILFDYGVVLSRGCIAGNISGFVIYDPNNKNWMWN